MTQPDPDFRYMDYAVLMKAQAELDRQFEPLRTCHICEAQTFSGYWTTCWHCGLPVCDSCAVQADDGHWCPTCLRETPF